MDIENENAPGAVNTEGDNSNQKSNPSNLVDFPTDGNPRTRLEWIQWLVSKHPGIKAFVIEPNSKRPLGGNSWYIRNSSDPQQLAEWADMTPEANWGVWWGREFVAIDLDIKCDVDGFSGIDNFEAICLENGITDFRTEIKTLMVRTPSGGYHIIFKTPHPCANKNTFPSGIDVRGAIGYTVFASKDKRGKWEVINPEADIVDIPEFLLEYLVSPGVKDPNHSVPLIELDQEENVEQATAWLMKAQPAIAGENGDDHTYDICCMLRDFGISETEALNVLNESGWNERCEPAWDSGELEAKIKNSYSFGQNRPGVKAESYLRGRLMAVRASRGPITDEQVRAMFSRPRLAVDNTARLAWEEAAAGIPSDVGLTRPVAKAPVEENERRPFKLRDEAEQDNQPDIEWLIDGVLQRETLALFYGPENSFKSFLVLDLVLSAAAGMPWASYGGREDAGGFAPKRPLTTVYIAGEGSHGIEKLRRPAWRRHRGVTEPLPFYTVNSMPFFKSPTDVENMIAEIKEAGIVPDIIVIDTAARAMLDLDENSAKDTGVFVAACDRLKREFRCAVVVVHHSGKDDRKGARGSTNLPASFDTRFKVTGDTGSLVARIKNEKMKDGEPWSMPVSFQGEQVILDDGRRSLVFGRVPPNAAKAKEPDPLLSLALAEIAEWKGKMPLSMNGLAEEMALRYATEELSAGELEKAKEGMRNYLKKAVRGELARFAHKNGTAKHAPWVFEDRSGRMRHS